jgi:hypothetical protein
MGDRSVRQSADHRIEDSAAEFTHSALRGRRFHDVMCPESGDATSAQIVQARRVELGEPRLGNWGRDPLIQKINKPRQLNKLAGGRIRRATTARFCCGA